MLRLIEQTQHGISTAQLRNALRTPCASSTLYRTLRDLEQQGFVRHIGHSWQAAGIAVVVELSAQAPPQARQHVWHPNQQLTELAHGGAYLSFRAPQLPAVAAWVASLGGTAQAVEPNALVVEVVRLHRSGIETHRAGIESRDELRTRGLSSLLPPPLGV